MRGLGGSGAHSKPSPVRSPPRIAPLAPAIGTPVRSSLSPGPEALPRRAHDTAERHYRHRTGGKLNDADPVRVVLLQSKQRLLGSNHAVGVIFSVVAEQAHGDPVGLGANCPVVAGEILGVANFAGLACAAHQLLDLAALAGVKGRLAGVEVQIERHDLLISPSDSKPQRASLCTSLSPFPLADAGCRIRMQPNFREHLFPMSDE